MRRELGQLSLADGLVAGGAGRNRQLERIAALVDYRRRPLDAPTVQEPRDGGDPGAGRAHLRAPQALVRLDPGALPQLSLLQASLRDAVDHVAAQPGFRLAS